MKFHELPMGARFEFEGVEYVKNGVMTATANDGSQRLIRRSASLKPLDPALLAAANQPASGQLDRHQVMRAFDDFYQACLQIAGRSPQLESARRQFLDKLQ